ncbi:MAG: serine/threonine-protein kinase [Myxococcota bacterium]
MFEPRTATSTASAVSRYRFVQRLATGGMAEIYVADAAGAAGVTRRVAIKRVLPVHASEQVFTNMFVNEARVASTLQHPNIVQTYDVIDDGGSYSIVMELLQGLNLMEFHRFLYKTQRGFSIRQALYIVDRVLAGLHYAHERRTHDGRPLEIVHRDVSPHNVFLTADGGVKLLDFGVAKAAQVLEKRETESGVVKGKVLYMSPEQCQGLEIDRRADIWAAGVLLYVLLTGAVPFKGKNPYDTMRAVIHDYPVSPSSRVPELGPEVDAIVIQALAKQSEHRFATARDMQRAIGDVVRQHGWYLTELEFTGFVEGILAERGTRPSDVQNLPDDLIISEGGTEQLARFPGVQHESGASAAETPHAVVEQVGGITIVRLRGSIDETFEPDALIPHLEGVVIIDSEAVTRITSYGIRGLLTLFGGAASRLAGVYHIRCSVALVQQVGMIRKLLAGGKVLSYHLPYVDPVTGNVFTELVSGMRGEAILESRKAPRIACPGFPDRTAEFDEDESSYLCFMDDYLAQPPPHVASVVDALAIEERRRQVEKAVSAMGTEVWIRRPIDETYRWSSAFAGVEGAVLVDMSATPSWTDAGLVQLVEAVRREGPDLTKLSLVHAPAPLYDNLRKGALAGILDSASSVRVHARCLICNAPRRVALTIDRLSEARPGAVLDSAECPTCGSAVTCNEDLAHLLPSTPGKPEKPAKAPVVKAPRKRRKVDRSRQLFWIAVVLAWVGLIGLVALLAFSLIINLMFF